MTPSWQLWRDRRGHLSPSRIGALALLFFPLAKALVDVQAIMHGARPLNDMIHRAGFWALVFLGVTLADGRPVIELQERAGPRTQGRTAVIATAPFEGSPDATLYLRIRARGARYDFSYAYRPDAWVLLKGDADGTILSTKVAGGFVGTMLGMYAYHPVP